MDHNDSEVSLKCLHKTLECNSSECMNITECNNSSLNTHCYAIFKKINSTNSTNLIISDNLIDLENNDGSKGEILLAGCWSGGSECESPIKLKEKYENQNYQSTNYKIPESLLDPKIQNSCIGYSSASDDISYLKIHNQTLCCCSSNLCNKHIHLSNERNPYEMHALNRNPKPTIESVNNINKSNNNFFLTQGELNSILITSLVFILLFSIGFLFIFIFKKRKFFLSLNKNNLPNIYYSNTNTESNSPTILINSNQSRDQAQLVNMNINTNNTELNQVLGINQSKDEMINDYINFSNKINKSRQLMNNEEFKSLTQPLLTQTEGVFPTPMIAPNIEVLPDTLFRPNTSRQQFNYPDLANRNDLKDLENVKASLELQLLNNANNSNNVNLNSDTNECINLDLLPKVLQTIDIYLIEKISQGQFSSVWKGRCINSKNDPEDSNVPEYGIKIFSGLQKSAWTNEKDIYNTLSTTNPNILKYFCSSVHELPKNQQQNPNSYFPFSSNEYWIITEYHPNGSLYDFLKLNLLSWSQMLKLVNSILEGLAYLHSESNKTFAIAHRDLKSKNVLVKIDGQSCCIADFGLALKLNNHNKLNSAEIRSKVGTRRYMSPELIEGAIAFSKETFLRIDVYACALVLWEVISRGDFYEETSDYKLPFEDEVGQNPSLEDMKEIVVDKSIRPTIKQSWLKHYKITSIAQTIEECWDVDLDARISSECAASRIRKIYQNSISN